MTLGVEEAILTSIGSYTVVWDFHKVKQGKLNHYIIKKADNKIVTNQFTFNEPESILVTMPESLRIEKRVRAKRKY